MDIAYTIDCCIKTHLILATLLTSMQVINLIIYASSKLN